jgi:hypothetical protein
VTYASLRGHAPSTSVCRVQARGPVIFRGGVSSTPTCPRQAAASERLDELSSRTVTPDRRGDRRFEAVSQKALRPSRDARGPAAGGPRDPREFPEYRDANRRVGATAGTHQPSRRLCVHGCAARARCHRPSDASGPYARWSSQAGNEPADTPPGRSQGFTRLLHPPTVAWPISQPPLPPVKSFDQVDWTANLPVLNVMSCEAP